MICAFCLEPINEGARVCKACTRKQPMCDAQRSLMRRMALRLGIAALVVGALALWLTNAIARTGAVDGTFAYLSYRCPALKMPKETVEIEIARQHTVGTSWKSATEAVIKQYCPRP